MRALKARARVGRTRGGASGHDFPLGVVDQGLEVALVPQVHSLREAPANVLGPTDPLSCLQHCCGEHQRSLRVPEALANASEFSRKDGQKPPPHFTGRCLEACGGQLRHPAPPTLPESVGGNAAIQVGPSIVMRVVTKGGIQKAIRLGYDVVGQIGSLIRCYHRRGGRLWIVSYSGVGSSSRWSRCSWGANRIRSYSSVNNCLGFRMGG
jgi:hypothetical protein